MKEAWFWSDDAEAEQWSGPLPTREAAIAAGEGDHGVFYVARGVPIDPCRFMPNAYDVIDMLQQRIYDNTTAEDEVVDVSGAAAASLDSFLQTWCREHCSSRWHNVDGATTERIDRARTRAPERGEEG